MAFTLATDLINRLADEVTADVDASSPTAGTVEIYDDSAARPSSANDAVPGTSVSLAVFTLNDPSFGAAAAGVITLDVTPALTTTGDAAGTALWARVRDGAGNTVCDGSVTATGGGGDFQMSTTTVSVDLDLDLTAGTVTMPAG